MRLKLNSIPAFAVDRIEISKKSTGIDDLKCGFSCSVYSSCAGNVSVESGIETGAEITFFDITGKTVFKGTIIQGMNEISLHLSGTLFYRIITKTGNQLTGKVFVK